ncbi:MAG: hypothetical protein J7M05_00475 [Anaerolineae bacterium]|nr:hypothetical protein [Anaerolineae bacterium]
MPKFISVTWSEGVTSQESDILVQTISQMLKGLFLRYPSALWDPPLQVRVFGNWVIPALAAARKPYWGAQWYVEASYNRELGRVIAPTFLELVRREPWQQAEPHLDIILLDQDLTDFPTPLARLRPEHYTLGTSLPGSMAVMSVYRLRQIQGEKMRELALARLVRHHLGHILGVPLFTRKDEISRLGLETHCTNRCTMRHAHTVEELVEYAREETEMGWPFCEHCTRDLVSILVRLSHSWS